MDQIMHLAEPYCTALIKKHEKAYHEKRQMQIIPRRIDLYSTNKGKKRSLMSQGDHLLAKIRYALHFFDATNDFERSAHQRQFHESMIAACVRHIYADEFSANFVSILEQNHWENARQEIMICCPRRFGKHV